jgi:hypothetical protein
MKFTPHYSDNPSKKSRSNSDNLSDFDGRISNVARKEYLSHPITKEWTAEVRAELKRRGRGSQARLYEYLKARVQLSSSGHLTDILNGKYDTSDIVEPVHEFLKWPMPLPPIASKDAAELVHGWERLTADQRAKIVASAQEVSELSGDEARDLIAILFGQKKRA